MKNYKAFIGIDVSKHTLDAVIIKSVDKKNDYYQFSNDTKGYKELLKWSKQFAKCKSEELFFCMEHTGVYVLQLSCFLSDCNINFCLENALQIKRSMGISRIKNDKADAKMIARYAFLHHNDLKLYSLPTNIILKLKAFIAYRTRLVKSKQAFHSASKELSKHSSTEIHTVILEDSQSLIKSINEKIRSIDKAILELIKSDEEMKKNYMLAISVGGVGKSIAAYMIACTNNFTKFIDARKFACYTGIAPFEHSSGISMKGRTKISQLADKQMKGLLSIGACSAIQHDNELRNYYNKRLEEGKSALSVLNIIKNKIVSRVFAVVKRGSPYVSIANYN